MRCLGLFLTAAVLVCVTGCGRTNLNALISGEGGAVSLAGVTVDSDTPPTGGVASTGGSISAFDASTRALDTCAIAADCTMCIWETAPTNSAQCTGSYYCAGIPLTKSKCETNQAAWNSYCPNQAPEHARRPCMGCPCDGGICLPLACVDGRCLVSRCPTP